MSIFIFKIGNDVIGGISPVQCTSQSIFSQYYSISNNNLSVKITFVFFFYFYSRRKLKNYNPLPSRKFSTRLPSSYSLVRSAFRHVFIKQPFIFLVIYYQVFDYVFLSCHVRVELPEWNSLLETGTISDV